MLPKNFYLSVFSISAGLVQSQRFREVRTFEIQSLEDLENIVQYVKRSQDILQQQYELDEDAQNGRAITKSMLSQIDQYGCWCHFDDFADEFHTAKGTPMDGFDNSCKQYYHAMQCLISDNMCGVGVDPHKVIYTLVITSSDNELDYDCISANNDDDCKIAVCQSQLKLHIDFSEEFEAGNFINIPDYSASQGNFDFIAQCSATGLRTDRELLGCCGEYQSGTRRPVMVEDGTAVDSGCCAKPNGAFLVYNTFIEDCCSEAPYLRPMGTCDD